MSSANRLASAQSRADMRDQVRSLQRARILEAMTEIVAACGLQGTTIAAIITKARVSRVTFAEIFGSVEQAFVALVEHVTGAAAVRVREAFERESSWTESVLAGIEAVLVFFDSDSSLAHVCLIDALAGPPAALENRARLLQPLVGLVDGARDMLPADRQPSPVMAEAAVASVAGMLHARLVAGEAPPFIALLGELAELVVCPYLGSSQAAEVAHVGEQRARAVVKRRAAAPSHPRVPIPEQLQHARARQARACVLYIAEHPGSSNRLIASGIGVRHLGQVSTLLLRLHQLELLTKQAGGAGRPNAWALSPHGQGIVRSLHERL